MTDDPRRAQLRRMKAIALAMLLAMLAGFVLSHAMGNQGVWAWVSAFCEAATVGALADWFAVVALFRHPLGLPIPHTAIIPRNKARIADSLAAFVRDHFLEPQNLLARLEVFDPAARLGQWLAQPQQSRKLARMARGWALQALDLLDERAVRESIQRFVVARLQAWDAAATAGEVLGLLTADDRHQQLLDEALKRLSRYLDGEAVKQRASELLVKHARREWPKLVGTVNLVKPVEGIADDLAERIARAVLDELNEILVEPGHPIRRDYERWLRGYIKRLRQDPDLAARVARSSAPCSSSSWPSSLRPACWVASSDCNRAPSSRPRSRAMSPKRRSSRRWRSWMRSACSGVSRPSRTASSPSSGLLARWASVAACSCAAVIVPRSSRNCPRNLTVIFVESPCCRS